MECFKVCFKSKHEAFAEMKKRKWKKGTVYKCTFCDLYHLAKLSELRTKRQINGQRLRKKL